MMNTGFTTKTWSDAPQESSFKADNRQSLSAQDKTKMPQGKDVGTILNEAADPNWVDPAKLRKGAGNPDLDKDAFFKLMLAQIKAQDPTNPMQSHEMASQLAQFTSLEQLYNINSGIEGLKKGQEPQANYQVLNFLGKSVSADSSRVIREKGDKTHELRFKMQSDAPEAKITIFDSSGKEIRNYKISNVKSGDNRITWNGLGDDGQPARAGEYQFKVQGKNSNGKTFTAQTTVSGKITGVNFTNQGPVLMVGNQTLRLSDVTKLEDENLKAEEAQKDSPLKPDNASAPSAAQPQMPSTLDQLSGLQIQKPPVKPEEDVPAAPPALTSNLDAVKMAPQTMTNAMPKNLITAKKESEGGAT